MSLTKQALRALAPFAEPPHVDDDAELLPTAPLDAIAYGFTSSAYVIGDVEGEAEMSARLERPTRGIPVVAACRAARLRNDRSLSSPSGLFSTGKAGTP
jgi:maleate cis-trans isomerase